MSPNRLAPITRRPRLSLLAAGLLATGAVAAPGALAQENADGDAGPDDTSFTYEFSAKPKLSRSITAKVAVVAGPQTPGTDLGISPSELDFSPSVYAVTLSYGLESRGRIKDVLAVNVDSGTAGATKTVKAKLTSAQLRVLRAAAEKAGRKKILVTVAGVARRVNGGDVGVVRRSTRLTV